MGDHGSTAGVVCSDHLTGTMRRIWAGRIELDSWIKLRSSLAKTNSDPAHNQQEPSKGTSRRFHIGHQRRVPCPGSNPLSVIETIASASEGETERRIGSIRALSPLRVAKTGCKSEALPATLANQNPFPQAESSRQVNRPSNSL